MCYPVAENQIRLAHSPQGSCGQVAETTEVGYYGKKSKHCNNGTNDRAWGWGVAVLFWLKDFRKFSLRRWNGTLQQADQGAEGQRWGPRREGWNKTVEVRGSGKVKADQCHWSICVCVWEGADVGGEIKHGKQKGWLSISLLNKWIAETNVFSLPHLGFSWDWQFIYFCKLHSSATGHMPSTVLNAEDKNKNKTLGITRTSKILTSSTQFYPFS